MYVLISLVALLASALTLFSGFGLGTILLPVFTLFFPLDTSIALTAIVHLLNNLFKLFLLGKHADKNTVLLFGLPSVAAAFLGAILLGQLNEIEPVGTYQLWQHTFVVTVVKLVIAAILLFFALFDLIPKLAGLQFDKKYLPLGGFLSGFFGGLSGNQGALRSAFLIRSGLSKEAFIASGVVIACLVDLTRLFVYSGRFSALNAQSDPLLLIVATLSAFAGAYFGNKLLKKVTVTLVQRLVAVLLILFSIALGAGLV